jgi:hypothetical protein
MREDICYDGGTCAASGEYEGQAEHLWKQGERGGFHMTCCGWDSWVCGEFSFHECATADMYYITATVTFSCVLTYSEIVHGGYKSIHH